MENKAQIDNFHELSIMTMFCRKYPRRIFYEFRNFKIRFFEKFVNLKSYQDCHMNAFSLDVNAFQETIKRTSKSGFFDKSSEYSVKKIFVEYSMSLEISNFDFFGNFLIRNHVITIL